MPLINYSTADTITWRRNAYCTTTDFDFIPDIETEAGCQEAQTWCNRCPVRAQCLAWAMLHSAEGYWGGTTTYQRTQLRRVRTRAKCPICRSTTLAYTGSHELCLACGVSWTRDVREAPINARPVPHAAA